MSVIISTLDWYHQVPAQYEDAHARVGEVFEKLADTLTDWAEWNLDAVVTRDPGGFIPFTDGGWDLVGYETIGGSEGSGTTPQMLRKTADQQYEQMVQDWGEQHPDIEWDPNGEHSDECQEFEYEWMSGGLTFFYKIRCTFWAANNRRNDTHPGVDIVSFNCGINDDFEYGRDRVGSWAGPGVMGDGIIGTHWVHEVNLPLSELTDARLAEIAKELIDKLAAA